MEGDCVRAWCAGLVESAWEADEYRILTVDGTFKIGLGVRGFRRVGISPDDSLDAPTSSAWGAGARPPRVLTVRGASGFLLGTPLVVDEAAAQIAEAMGSLIPEEERRSAVRFVVVDQCTRELHLALREVFPNLVCVAQDTQHLVMKVQDAHGKVRKPVTHLLSRIMGKFNRAPDAASGGANGVAPGVWDGEPTEEEKTLLRHVRECTLPPRLQKRAEALVGQDAPWGAYREYLLAMAWLTTRFSMELRRRTRKKGKPLLRVLVAACSYSRWSVYANNVVLRSFFAQGTLSLLPCGTTGNEALHAEMRNAFRQVYSIHVPTLRLRLSTFTLAKMIAWNAAVRFPGLRQRRQQGVLARVLARPLLPDGMWSAWVAREPGALSVPKAPAPMRAELRAAAARVRRWQALSGRAGSRRTVKRTVFTPRHAAHLTGGGAGWGRRGSGASAS